MAINMRRIFWAGDSTVQTNTITTYPQTGIGQAFSLYVKEDVGIMNHARNGRSTKSFIEDGRLRTIEEGLAEGDFLFIQFAHNDEKSEDPSRYTEPFSTFMDNLTVYAETAIRQKAYPVFITPLERRCFADDIHLGMGAHSDYVAAMKQTAEQLKLPLVDLYSMSREEMKKAGKTGSRKWFMNFDAGLYDAFPQGLEDNSHLRYEGAVVFAGLIAKGLRELGGRYADLLLEE